MSKRHEATYTKKVLRKDGSEYSVLMCAYCDRAMTDAKWTEFKEGILYECQGKACSSCGQKVEKSYNLKGNE